MDTRREEQLARRAKQDARLARQRLLLQRIHQYAVLIVSIIVTATAHIFSSLYDREPYHTSILTGQGWVMELITGHPERIRCELGVHHHVFAQMISELREMGYCNSRYVSLEEQLAIFLYSYVTGLTVEHVGEHFQRSNETITR